MFFLFQLHHPTPPPLAGDVAVLSFGFRRYSSPFRVIPFFTLLVSSSWNRRIGVSSSLPYIYISSVDDDFVNVLYNREKGKDGV